MLPHQDRIEAGVSRSEHIVRPADARFGNPQQPLGDGSRQSSSPAVVDTEVAKISLVHPDDVSPRAKGPLDLNFVVSLDKCRQAEFAGEANEIPQLGIVERSHNQQDGVGAVDADIADIEGGESEILTQDRQSRARSGGDQVVPRATEELFIGEHRQGSGPPGGIGLRESVGA